MNVVAKAVWEWLVANDLPASIPMWFDFELTDTAITVETFMYTPDGRIVVNGGRILTEMRTFPLKEAPPPGLLEAYRRAREHALDEERIREDERSKIAKAIELGLWHASKSGRFPSLWQLLTDVGLPQIWTEKTDDVYAPADPDVPDRMEADEASGN